MRPDDPDFPMTPTYLWRVLREFLRALFAIFGEPAAIARRLHLPACEHRNLSHALAALEHLLRRLLLIDALALTAQPVSEAKRRLRRGMETSTGALFDPEMPERWAATFSPLRNASAKRARARGAKGWRARAIMLPSAPLALRMQALLRGFNDPAPLAQRLANVMARQAARVLALCMKRPSRVIMRHPYGRILADAQRLTSEALAASLTPACDSS